MNMFQYKVIGLMSGTSLDGLDIACCRFTYQNDRWQFELLNCQTIEYDSEWKKRLAHIEQDSALEYAKLHVELGEFFGKAVQAFVAQHGLEVDFVASHGHTVFHQPQHHLTTQIGSGAAIAAACGLPVVCDFRSLDVALGGQGAPLVPIGDRLLFGDYDLCLNVGGIANISFEKQGRRLAFDICPANMVLNSLARQAGKEFDEDGRMARSGRLSEVMLEELDTLDFYRQPFPKSLGKEWVLKNIFPRLVAYAMLPLEDQLCTFTHHIARQIAAAVKEAGFEGRPTMLITGGGAFNLFLCELIEHYGQLHIKRAEAEIVKFKEALIFAFLGVLRWRNEVNCLQSVTGAQKDNSGGTIYLN